MISISTLIIAAAAWIVGFVIAFLVCRRSNKKLQDTIRKLRKGKDPKKMGVMDKVLIFEAIILILYTIADLVVFWHTGNEPMTLTGCVFGVCGLENGVMGWIKTNKENNNNAPGVASSPSDAPPDPSQMP